MKTPILWVEIPVSDFARAVAFYENVFETKLEIQTIFDKTIAVFDKDAFGIKASLNQVDNYTGTNGIKPFFYVNIMSDAIEAVAEFGGVVTQKPALLKQTNKNGDIIIGSNLIDNQVGYYAEIKDSEGNHLYLYSHS